MNYSALFAFLTDLKAHNDRPWFQEHKATYDQLRAEFEEDVNFWAAELAKLDPALAGIQARKSLFRIYRDVRFSKNKDPYKTHFSAYFTAGPSKDIDSPGYYLQLGPQGQTLIAGGLYMPDKAQLAAIRQEIDYNADRLHGILKAPDYQAYFSGLGGDRLQRPPVGYAADHPEVELLKHKGFIGARELADAEVLKQKDFRAYVLGGFRTLVPLCEFLREAVSEVKG